MGAKTVLQSQVQQHRSDLQRTVDGQACLHVYRHSWRFCWLQGCHGAGSNAGEELHGRLGSVVCMYGQALSECLGPVEARRGYLLPWNCSDVWLWAAVWFLEFILGSSTGTPNHWAIWPGHSVVNNYIPWAFIPKYQLWLLCFHEPSGLSHLCLLLHKISVEAYSDPNISTRTHIAFSRRTQFIDSSTICNFTIVLPVCLVSVFLSKLMGSEAGTLSVSSYLVLLGDMLCISNRNHWLI